MLKNEMLKAISYVAGALVLVGGSALDSNSLVPTLMAMVGEAWLILFVIANYDRFRGDDK